MLIIPEEIFYLDGELVEGPRSKLKKVIKEAVVPILIISVVIGVFSFTISHSRGSYDPHSPQTYYQDEISNVLLMNQFQIKSPYSSMRFLSDESNFETDFDSGIEKLIQKLNQNSYKGEWENNSKNEIFPQMRNEGNMYLHFSTSRKVKPDNFSLSVRITRGKYIGYWQNLNNVIKISNILLENDTDYLYFKGNFDTKAEKGKNFDKTSSESHCESTIFLKFKINKENNTVDYLNNITGRINSTCNILEFEFVVSLEDMNIEYQVVTWYSATVSLISFFSILNTVWINLKLNDSETFARSISLITVYQNVIWNSYGCLCHFFLTINYGKYFLQFLLPTLFYFINFSITDLRFLYGLWRMKYKHILTDPLLVRKKLIQLYCVFYIVMFLSLFYVTKFYFSKPYVIFGVSMTWVPQIVYNIVNNNKVAMPWVYIIFTSFYRLYVPCYFRGNKHNFFLISPDYRFVGLCAVTMFLFLCVMYSQMIYGPRWFLPNRWKNEPFDFYKTKEELVKIKPDWFINTSE